MKPIAALLLLSLVYLPGGSLVAAERRAPVTAVFLDPGALIYGIYPSKRKITATDMRAKIDALHELGIKTVVITYVEYIGNQWGAFYPSELKKLNQFPNLLGFDLIETVLSQATKNGQSVMLGIGRGGDAFLTYNGCKDSTRLQVAHSHAKKVVRELHAKYATRHNSFGGWYITHECRDIKYASAYYNPVADLCHELTPGKPVMIAPDGAPVADAEVIASSHADIFAYQDAVGAGFVPPPKERYSYNSEKRLDTLNTIYKKYASWHADNPKKQIWATVEIWQMDGPRVHRRLPRRLVTSETSDRCGQPSCLANDSI